VIHASTECRLLSAAAAESADSVCVIEVVEIPPEAGSPARIFPTIQRPVFILDGDEPVAIVEP
jgi:hypothetical protein